MVINGQVIAREGSVGGLTGQMCTEVAESRELVTEAQTSQRITICKSFISATPGLHLTVHPFLLSGTG